MTRYFFDVNDTGVMQKDDEGTEFSDLANVRTAAMRLLSDIARDAVHEGGDHRSFMVVVTDENAASIYSATLTYAGLWAPRGPSSAIPARGDEPGSGAQKQPVDWPDCNLG